MGFLERFLAYSDMQGHILECTVKKPTYQRVTYDVCTCTRLNLRPGSGERGRAVSGNILDHMAIRAALGGERQ